MPSSPTDRIIRAARSLPSASTQSPAFAGAQATAVATRFEVHRLDAGPGGTARALRIDLHDHARQIGTMLLTLGMADGVIQIIDIQIDPSLRRIGHGSTLFVEGLRQASLLLAPALPRRVVVLLGQKSQLLARAFILRHGFHHIKTLPSLGANEDVMVYVKGLN